MDDLRSYVLFDSASVISGRKEADNERLCAMESQKGKRLMLQCINSSKIYKRIGKQYRPWSDRSSQYCLSKYLIFMVRIVRRAHDTD